MLKISENPISAASLYAVARTICLLGANLAAKSVQRRTMILLVLSSILERTIHPVWKIDQ